MKMKKQQLEKLIVEAGNESINENMGYFPGDTIVDVKATFSKKVKTLLRKNGVSDEKNVLAMLKILNSAIRSGYKAGFNGYPALNDETALRKIKSGFAKKSKMFLTSQKIVDVKAMNSMLKVMNSAIESGYYLGFDEAEDRESFFAPKILEDKIYIEKLIKEAIESKLDEDYMPAKYNSVQDLIKKYKPTIMSYLENGKLKFAMKIMESVIRDAYQLGQDEMEAKMVRMHKRGELD